MRKREVKQDVVLTGDHWTSVSNNNYFGVTAHTMNDDWKLKSFALSVPKTTPSHFGNARTED